MSLSSSPRLGHTKRMPDFANFDTRGYRTVDVRSGYADWVSTYQATVAELMDIPLLEALRSVPWASLSRAADLGCGTGRTGAWLRGRGVAAIDGIDLTPEMLAVARERGVYRRLVEGATLPPPVSRTGPTICSRSASSTSTCPNCRRCTARRGAWRRPTDCSCWSDFIHILLWPRGCRPTFGTLPASRWRSRLMSTY